MSKFSNLLKGENVDAYIAYDFRGNNYIARKVLDFDKHTTRKWVCIVSTEGLTWIIPAIEESHFNEVEGTKLVYKTYQEFEMHVSEQVVSLYLVALDVSENNNIAAADIVPSGFIELIKKRNSNLKVTSASNLTQKITSAWGAAGLETHKKATYTINLIRDEAYELIKKSLRDKKEISDFEVTEFILKRYEEEKVFTEDEVCIVSTNERTGNPHYFATKDRSNIITPNSVLLFDMWVKDIKNPKAIYSDSTFMAWIGPDPVNPRVQEIWDVVREARDIGINLVLEKATDLEGWEVDRAVRDFVISKGYGDYFVHRTGHSIDTQEHGSGADLDDLEKKDTRKLIPDSGFSIEPGIYLKEFGVRSEVDMYINEDGEPEVTTFIQNELFLI